MNRVLDQRKQDASTNGTSFGAGIFTYRFCPFKTCLVGKQTEGLDSRAFRKQKPPRLNQQKGWKYRGQPGGFYIFTSLNHLTKNKMRFHEELERFQGWARRPVWLGERVSERNFSWKRDGRLQNWGFWKTLFWYWYCKKLMDIAFFWAMPFWISGVGDNEREMLKLSNWGTCMNYCGWVLN